MNKTIALAQQDNLCSGVYSFYPHPLKIIAHKPTPPRLITEERKIEKLRELGVDYYFQQKFTQDFSEIPFENFIKDILVNKINVRHVVVGQDFRFGHQGQGNVNLLQEYGAKYGFEVTALPAFKIEGRKVSSSYIRKLVHKGQVKEIPKYLGEYYKITGQVVHGHGRGRKLGFPTANLNLLTNYALPKPGVYAGYTYFKGQKYKSVTNYGDNPTFSNSDFTIEIHILGLTGDIYDCKVTFEFIDFIRKEEKYNDVDQLKEQIYKDILYTREILC
ncbi:MAG: bifunctional riboflavin kinase/FAD synthetase [Bacillota bacterium]